jgi:hypothetical protein
VQIKDYEKIAESDWGDVLFIGIRLLCLIFLCFFLGKPRNCCIFGGKFKREIMDQYLLQIKSECMGVGDEALGKMLTRSFLNNLINQQSLPSHIILYNSGVLLALDGTDSANALKELEKRVLKF